MSEPHVQTPEEKAREAAEQAALPYKWTQTLEDVTVTFPVPNGTRAKQMKVEILPNKIIAGVRDESPVIQGELFNKVDVEESTWSVVDQKELSITLVKAKKPEWWPHVVTSAPKINVQALEPENSKLSDLDGETRAMVEKMMFDQRQKQAGLPTSDEMNKMKMFEQFKAQHPEMDFSNVKFS